VRITIGYHFSSLTPYGHALTSLSILSFERLTTAGGPKKGTTLLMRKVLFIDRDGTIIVEPILDQQVDSLEKLEFYPGAIEFLSKIAKDVDYDFVMVTNQDGLGTESFPEETFWPVHNKMLEDLKKVDVSFKDIIIDRSFEHEKMPTRKPGTELLKEYMSPNYDLAASYVIGDRLTDMELARNLGAKAFWIGEDSGDQIKDEIEEKNLANVVVFHTQEWREIYEYLKNVS